MWGSMMAKQHNPRAGSTQQPLSDPQDESMLAAHGSDGSGQVSRRRNSAPLQSGSSPGTTPRGYIPNEGQTHGPYSLGHKETIMSVLYKLVHRPAIGRDAWHASVQCIEQRVEPFHREG
jgi:hypothetical protein